MSGNIQVKFDSLGTALPPIKAGLLRPLGVSSTERIGDLPDVPTMADGLSRQRLVWSSCTPPRFRMTSRQKLSASLERGLNDEAFRALLEKVGFPPLRPRSAAGIREFIDADRARWARVIKALNISLD